MDKVENRDSPHRVAVAKYNAKNTVQVPIRLNKKTDADILARLDEVPSKMGYVKALIRKDIASEKQN